MVCRYGDMKRISASLLGEACFLREVLRQDGHFVCDVEQLNAVNEREPSLRGISNVVPLQDGRPDPSAGRWVPSAR